MTMLKVVKFYSRWNNSVKRLRRLDLPSADLDAMIQSLHDQDLSKAGRDVAIVSH